MLDKFRSDRSMIIKLTVPAVLQTVIRSLFVIIDAYWVGKLGSSELAALTSATFLVWGFLALGELISTGTSPLIAQALGRGDLHRGKEVSTINLILTFFYSLILGYVLIPILPFFYFLMSISDSQAHLSGEYLIVLLTGYPCVILLSTLTAVFRGNGDTRTPFYLLLFAVILNFILAPVFIFGFLFIPSLKIGGAALSTLTSFLVAFITGYVILRRRNLLLPLFSCKIKKDIIFDTFRIGFPIAFNGVAFSAIYVIIARFVSDYGITGFASLGIGHRSESLAYQITLGFSLASTIIVGYYIGSNNIKRAEILAWKILGYASTVIFIYSILLFVFSKEIAMLFSLDPVVIDFASSYNKLAAIVQIFSAAEVILSGAFAGAGYTIPPAATGLFFNLLRIPLVALFSYFFGLNGIWVAICLTVFLKGLIISLWFLKGTWRNKIKKADIIPPPVISSQETF